eukprot:13079551-Alexandrium_andersonii.AAC.1
MPKPRPPAAFPKTFRFNETVGIDLLEYTFSNGHKVDICNMVCWGTLYQVCVPIPDKSAATVAKTFCETWVRYFGPPLVLIADQGREFVGSAFSEMCDRNAVLLHIVD